MDGGFVEFQTGHHLNRGEWKNDDNHTNTHHKLLPGLIDAFENPRDPPVILLKNCGLSAYYVRQFLF